MKKLFRSWNEIDKCFYYFENGKYYTSLDFKEELYSEVFNWKNAEQYTGLKDKNGSEIFEGDIIETPLIGSVHWDEQYLQYYVIYEDDSEPLDIGFEKEIEIIGNIHDK